MCDVNTVLLIVGGLYVLGMSVFMILENRRPQATMAWLLSFFFLPVISVVVYILFGRDRKAFSKQSELLMQDLEQSARPLLAPLLARQGEEIARLEGKSASHKRLMTLVQRNSRSALTRCNRAEILQNARAFYPRMIEDMKAARHSIHLQYFIWRADAFTEKLKDILCAKAEAGVEVRLLYDPVGSRAPMKLRYNREMRAAGIEVAPTSPLWRLHTISYRNHRKITVIDGAVGYTGGMNIGQEHLDGGEGFDSWRDTQLRIAGPGAVVLQAVFAVDWYNAVREDLFSEAYFPADVTNPAEPTGDEASASGNVPVQILTSGPDSHWAAIRQLYTRMIETAERHVVLQSPYFILDARMADALTSVRGLCRARPSSRQGGRKEIGITSCLALP